ncbi:alpha/beta fold hydrolase [Gordonia sp. TBRC 11910]|uniref:Alpha/beta fold hydrolase n=1 Tax=Gordonia asplenii TaxID=2725283 RepID=A0A848L3P7_9ACTN|nr:AMP-binding protein [Gordonia asplenii]NMO03223.1 alpha/beta fold hydrolase [Gordonia asplenii]
MRPPNPIAAALGAVPTSTDEAAQLIAHVGDTGRNVYEYLRFGGLAIDEVYSPYSVVVEGTGYSLRRYFPDDVTAGPMPPLVFVPPLMILADVYDASPRTGPVRAVHEHGIDVWVVDFGRPEDIEGGLKRNVADYVSAVSEVVDHVREITGKDVVLSGYSQGGLFSYLAAALRHSDGVDSVVSYGSSVVWEPDTPMSIPMSTKTYSTVARGIRQSGVFQRLFLPKDVARTLTKLTDPVKNAQFNYQYVKQLDDREKLLPNEQQRQFLDSKGWTSYPGPALEDLMDWVANRRLLVGGIVIGDRVVTLADMTNPVLVATGDADSLGNPATIRAVADAAPFADVYELALSTGHFGIIASSGAKRNTWPRVAEWLAWRGGAAPSPGAVVPVDQTTSLGEWRPGPILNRITGVVDTAVSVVTTAAGVVDDAVGVLRTTARDAAHQVGLADRLSFALGSDAVSAAGLLAAAGTQHPFVPAIFVDGVVVSNREFDDSINESVARLCAVGIRRDDHVGLLTSTHLSGLTILFALNRIGAVAVMLRDDCDLSEQLAAGDVQWVLADDENTGHRAEAETIPWFCTDPSGSVSSTDVRALPDVDVRRAALPQWYEPGPARTGQSAFIFFDLVGESRTPIARGISNERWLTAAQGAPVTRDDTVYLRSPLHHRVTQLLALGGAVARGARIALSTAADADQFWREIRRYGATHVSYAGADLRDIVDAPPHPLERRHPVRALVGADMPSNLSRRARDRFRISVVDDVYLGPEAELVLIGTTGPDAVRKRAPGTPSFAIAKYDVRAQRLRFDRTGSGRRCTAGETGMLLSDSISHRDSDRSVHGIFTPTDDWHVVGVLARTSHDGVVIVGDAADQVVTADGDIAPSTVRAALEEIPAVDLVIVDGAPRISATLTLRPGVDGLRGWDLTSALSRLSVHAWPAMVTIVDDIALDSHGRTSPASSSTVLATWVLDANRAEYRPNSTKPVEAPPSNV